MRFYLTFPVSRQSSQVLELCRAATKPCDLAHGICLGHRETFLAIHVQYSIRHRHLVKEFSTLGIKVLQVGIPCETAQGGPVSKSEEQIRGTKSYLVSRQSFQVLVEYKAATDACHLTHGICLGHRETFLAIHVLCSTHHRHLIKEFFALRLQVIRVRFQCTSTFLYWKIRFRNQVTTCSDFPSEAMLWIKEVEMVDLVNELKSSRTIAGKDFQNFELLDARIASALNKVIQNSHFNKKVSLEDQKVQKENRFLHGRQIAYMIYDYFRVTVAHDTVLDYADVFSNHSSQPRRSGIRYEMG